AADTSKASNKAPKASTANSFWARDFITGLPDACLVDGTLVTLLMPASHYDNNDAVLSWMIIEFLAAYLQWSGSSDNYRRNFSQRQYFLGGTAVNGFFRHTKHHRGGFILSDSARTGVAHLQQSPRAVVAHPGHDDAGGIFTGESRNRTKQYID